MQLPGVRQLFTDTSTLECWIDVHANGTTSKDFFFARITPVRQRRVLFPIPDATLFAGQ